MHSTADIAVANKGREFVRSAAIQLSGLLSRAGMLDADALAGTAGLQPGGQGIAAPAPIKIIPAGPSGAPPRFRCSAPISVR